MRTEQPLDLTAVTLDKADEKQRPLLEQAKASAGFVPNMYAYMANLPGLLHTYLEGQADFRAGSGFSSVEQEVVFLTISRANGCDYCMAAHSTLADGPSRVPTEVTDALRAGQLPADPKLAALTRFTQAMFETRGVPDQEQTEAFFAAGYEPRHVLGVILALGLKTLSNYANHHFHTPVDAAFAGRTWEA